MDKIIITIVGIAGIIFTYWFFLMKKDQVVEVSDAVDILVKGGYSPSTISIPKNKTTKLNFKREDESSCLEEVVISDFKIRQYLPMNKIVTLEITPKEYGEFPFSCGMNMFHGKILVKD